MSYVVLDQSNRCHVVHKGFSCTPAELNRELATHCRLKPADIQRVHIYDHTAADIIADFVNDSPPSRRQAAIQTIFYSRNSRIAQAANCQKVAKIHVWDTSARKRQIV